MGGRGVWVVAAMWDFGTIRAMEWSGRSGPWETCMKRRGVWVVAAM